MDIQGVSNKLRWYSWRIYMVYASTYLCCAQICVDIFIMKIMNNGKSLIFNVIMSLSCIQKNVKAH